MDADVQAERLFGRPREELIGMHHLDLYPPDEKKHHRTAFLRNAQGTSAHYQGVLLRADGTRIRVHVNASPFSIFGKHCIVGIFSEAAPEKEESPGVENRDFLNSIVNALDDPLVVKDESLRWVLLNDAACKQMGFPRECMLGKSTEELLSAAEAAPFQEADHRVLATGKTDISEAHLCILGTPKTVAVKKTPFIDSTTGKRYIVGTIRDITERKRWERALKESEERYRLFLKNFAGIAYQTKIDEYQPFFFHGRIKDITRYTEQEFDRGSITWDRLILPEDLPRHYAEADRFRYDPHFVAETEYRIRRKDGTIAWVRDVARSVRPRKGEEIIVQGAIYDVTERVKAESRLSRSQEELRNLSNHLQNLIEEERTRISREIHDDLGQALSSLKLDLR